MNTAARCAAAVWRAEQVVRFSLEGTEVALKLTGSAAKNVAAAIYAVLKNRDKNKIKGRQRLTGMLKSGKELKVFTVSEKHLKQFAREANRYGVVYCALRGKEKSADGMVDVMVRAEDASKINRIVERLKLATVGGLYQERDREIQRRTVKRRSYRLSTPGAGTAGKEPGGPSAGRNAGRACPEGGGGCTEAARAGTREKTGAENNPAQTAGTQKIQKE